MKKMMSEKFPYISIEEHEKDVHDSAVKYAELAKISDDPDVVRKATRLATYLTSQNLDDIFDDDIRNEMSSIEAELRPLLNN